MLEICKVCGHKEETRKMRILNNNEWVCEFCQENSLEVVQCEECEKWFTVQSKLAVKLDGTIVCRECLRESIESGEEGSNWETFEEYREGCREDYENGYCAIHEKWNCKKGCEFEEPTFEKYKDYILADQQEDGRDPVYQEILKLLEEEKDALE